MRGGKQCKDICYIPPWVRTCLLLPLASPVAFLAIIGANSSFLCTQEIVNSMLSSLAYAAHLQCQASPCYVLTAGNAVQGFRPVDMTEGRSYWSRPDVARAHGKTSWPSRGPPRGGWGAAVREAVTPGAQEIAASSPGAQEAIAEARAINARATLTAHMLFHGRVRAL